MATKIAGALGAISGNQASSQLVRTSTGILYALVTTSSLVLKIYKSTNNGLSWLQQDYNNSPQTIVGLPGY